MCKRIKKQRTATNVKKVWEQPWVLWVVYGLAAIVISVQRLALTVHTVPRSWTQYENYVIFKNSFRHLAAGLNPYGPFPDEQWDLFKYSPAFALFMAPFQALPDYLGLPLWNLLNALLPLAALLVLPVINLRQRVFCAWFILPELVVSLQNSQSNGLTLGLMLMAFVAFEQTQPFKAAGWITGATFLKLFGIFAAPFALLYPKKGSFLIWMAFWTILFASIPIVLVSTTQLIQVYQWWGELLSEDHSASIGLSVQGWLQTWFGWNPPKNAITVAGVALLFVGIIATALRAHTTRDRALLWAGLLLWVVIFNHKAESPTFVIALAGAALWYCTGTRKRWETVFLGIIFVFASLTPTDIFPRAIREQLVQPYVLKAVPCIALWGLITYRILFPGKPKQ